MEALEQINKLKPLLETGQFNFMKEKLTDEEIWKALFLTSYYLTTKGKQSISIEIPYDKRNEKGVTIDLSSYGKVADIITDPEKQEIIFQFSTIDKFIIFCNTLQQIKKDVIKINEGM